MTATVTATAAANRYQQRPATTHNTRRIRANLAYVRPEKRTVGTNTASAATVANTVAKPLDNACPVRTTLECRPSTRTATDGSGRCAHSYGSEGYARGVPDRTVTDSESQSLTDTPTSALTRGSLGQAAMSTLFASEGSFGVWRDASPK